jgi:glutamate formiminotransferase / formiminotetrahydrofolate cyclodeaminase
MDSSFAFYREDQCKSINPTWQSKSKKIGQRLPIPAEGIITETRWLRSSMTKPILECIPNYSEARRPDVIEAIMSSITSVPDVILLDRHSDLDHNRTVITFVGPPEAVEEAAFRSIAKAAALINLDNHTGEHPRIGATDVVPFVPISGLTMQESVQIARHLAQRVGQELNIPVYLYEEAATRPERVNLEYLRRGQYEALKREMGVNPERNPDFGPNLVGTAGATVVGARQPLIAYNVYLATDDVTIAEKIAKTIRFSSGGLRFVKALGLLVDGRAQVSMNLTNYRKTPMALVQETVHREAARYGVAIHHAELVGLIPQEALIDAAVWYLQLDQFKTEQVLEQKLFAMAQSSQKPSGEANEYGTDFLDALASSSPTPGGGSAAAYTGAAAASLVSMVAKVTIGKKKYASVEPAMQGILTQSESLRNDLIQSIQLDASAFDGVLAAHKLPKDTHVQQEVRRKAIEQATLLATQSPMRVANKSLQVLELAEQVVREGNTSALSDAATGASLAAAAISSAGFNVRINTRELPPNLADPFITELSGIEKHCAMVQERIRTFLHDRGL